MDDAIIDVENIMRRLRLNAAAGHPRSAARVVLDASLEVRSAVVYGSLIVVLVILPVFFLGGLSGTFFRPLATSYVLAIGASLVVALTVTPALCLLLLPSQATRRQEEAPLVRLLKACYRAAIEPRIQDPGWAIKVLMVSTAGALAVVPLLGEQFLPNFKEYDFLMHWVGKPGTSIEAMNRITLQGGRELLAIPGVRNFGSHTGRAEVADEVVGPNFTELWISLDPSVRYEETVATIQGVVDGYPGLYRDLLTYLRERIKEVLTGASATVVVRIFGPNLDELRVHAEHVAESIADVPGVVDLNVQPQIVVPQVDIRFRPEAGQQYGVTPIDVQTAVGTLIRGLKVGEFYEDQKVFDIMVWGEEHLRRNPASIGNLMIDTPLGGQVPVRVVAEVVVAPMRNEITREGGSRKIDVTFNVADADLRSVAEEVEARVAGLPFDAGYHPEVIGEWAEQRTARGRMLALTLLSVIGIFLILHADFESSRLAWLVFLSLPFALVGSVLGVLGTGAVLSLGSLVGLVTVLGIAARNGIMLVSHYRHLEREEGVAFGPELVLRGSEERLAPILMTALATGLALLPILLGGSRPGHEIEHPMAVVIVGGLVTSTLLNLFLIPGLYLRFARPRDGLDRG